MGITDDFFTAALPPRIRTLDPLLANVIPIFVGALRAVPTFSTEFTKEALDRLEGGLAIAERYEIQREQSTIVLPIRNNAAPDVIALKSNRRPGTSSFSPRYFRRIRIKTAVTPGNPVGTFGNGMVADQADSNAFLIDENTGTHTELTRVADLAGPATATEFSQSADAGVKVDPTLVDRIVQVDFPTAAANYNAMSQTNLGPLSITIPLLTIDRRIVFLEHDRVSGRGGEIVGPNRENDLTLDVESPDADCDRGWRMYWLNVDQLNPAC